MLEAREDLPGARARDRRRRRGARGHAGPGRRRGLESRASTPPRRPPQIGPDDILTLIYTSGTTGHPKGVQLTHHAIMFSAQGVEEIIPFDAGGRVISWLPAAHIAERMAHHYIPMVYAGTVTTCPDPREILSYLPQVRPTWFFAVPRIWEKLKAGLETMQAAQPERAAQAGRRTAMAASLRAGPAAAGGRAGARRARAAGGRGRRAAVLQAARDARARPGRRASTSAPRRRRSRCSSSSTRSGSSWPSCGGCRRPAASAPCNRPGAGQDRHGRPGRRRASR